MTVRAGVCPTHGDHGLETFDRILERDAQIGLNVGPFARSPGASRPEAKEIAEAPHAAEQVR
jgi:hypothetical protein